MISGDENFMFTTKPFYNSHLRISSSQKKCVVPIQSVVWDTFYKGLDNGIFSKSVFRSEYSQAVSIRCCIFDFRAGFFVTMQRKDFLKTFLKDPPA